MKKVRVLSSLIVAVLLVLSQVSIAFASTALEENQLISGTVQQITLEADANTGVTTALVTVANAGGQSQVVRITLEIAAGLGLVTLDGDGNPVINQLALGQLIEIDPATVIPDEQESQHPVGTALSAFFSDINELDYSVIMEAHDLGKNGFGVIAQALWLTRKLDGDASVFLAILSAKNNKDFSAFILEDGSSPTSWGQLKKLILDGDKKGNLGVVMSNTDTNGNDNTHNNGNKDKNKDKDKDKDNNGNGNDNKP